VCIEGKDKKRNSSYAVCAAIVGELCVWLWCVYMCSAFPAARGIPFEQMQTNGCLRYVHSIDRLGTGGPTARRADRPRECMQARAPPPSQRSYNAAGANDVRNRGTHPLTAFFTRRVPTQTMKVVKMARAEAAVGLTQLSTRPDSIKHKMFV
jgi:hypothetical protein